MVDPRRLKVDESYQRSIDSTASAKLILAIAEAWDWRLCVPLIVSQRPDGLFVIDGQHRQAAAVMRGDIGYLPCSLSQYASVADEARLFVAANRRRRAINRLDDFRAAVAAGDEEAVVIQELVEAAGLTVGAHTTQAHVKPGEITFTAGLRSALRRYGRDVVGAALDHLGGAFPDEKMMHPGAMFAALVAIHHTPPPDFDTDRLFRTLLKYDSETWAAEARLDLVSPGGQSRMLAMRKALLEQYASLSLAAAA